MKKIRVGVVGATGYTGEELVKILARHPDVELTYASGKEDRKEKLQDIFPYLKNSVDLDCRAFSFEEAAKKTDLVFLSLPHTASMGVAPLFLKAKKIVIDVSADYRLKDAATYEKFYRVKHTDTENLKQAVYGLPEMNREKIKHADLIANPGCYPTGAILGVLAGLKKGYFIPETIGIDAKSGVTGAGRKADKALNFSEVNESFKAYKLFEHQHVPEMDEALSGVMGKKMGVIFVPHLLPINRGILSTIYAGLAKKTNTAELIRVYEEFYRGEPFVKVYPDGALPEVKHVTHTNFCDIGLRVNEARGLAVLISVIDNLQKGAAGQAVQNMNIRCGFDERAGL